MQSLESQFQPNPACFPQVTGKREQAMPNLFKAHPASVGETYVEHMGSAFRFAVRLLGASLACFVHGLLPFQFTSTGSRTIKQLHQQMIEHRRRHGADTPQMGSALGGNRAT